MSAHAASFDVYIIRCTDGSYYTGITNNLERRLQQHNGERRGGARYTKGKGPVELVYIEKYKTRSEAAKREYEIKHTLTRDQKQQLIDHAAKEGIVKAIRKKMI